MTWLIVGLGNPGAQYVSTRHNVGRMAVEYFVKKAEAKEWAFNKKANGQYTSGTYESKKFDALLPDTFMNESGKAVRVFIKNAKEAENMIVVYDDLDLPVGSMKVSFDRGSGGHRGVESIQTVLKTKRFIRIRVGISPHTPGGKIKKPSGESAVLDFILDKIKESDMLELKKVFVRVQKTIATILTEGMVAAMNAHN